MKAYVRTDVNSQEVKLAEVSIPEIQADQVLVKVEAFAVGIHDRTFISARARFPYVIGTEGSGTIAKLGAAVNGHHLGERVLFKTELQPEGGCWAEFAATKASSMIPLPEVLSYVGGSSIPMAGGTALECMRNLGLNSGDTLFITGASGAIGSLVIQLAKAQGIRVAGSASLADHEHMRSLGVELAVDHKDVNGPAQVAEWSGGGVDALLAIQPVSGKHLRAVKLGGKVIAISAAGAKVAPERGITVAQMDHCGESGQPRVDLLGAMARGEVQIVFEKEYPFDQALEALLRTEAGRVRGKLVVKGL